MASVERGEPIAVELYGNLYQSVSHQLSQEWFGMLSGEAVPRGAIRYLCLLAVPCRTLEQAVLRCRDFFELCRGFKIKQTLQRGDSESLFSIVKLSGVDEAEFNELIQSTSPDVIKATMAVMQTEETAEAFSNQARLQRRIWRLCSRSIGRVWKAKLYLKSPVSYRLIEKIHPIESRRLQEIPLYRLTRFPGYQA